MDEKTILFSMSGFFFILMIIAMFLVVASLATGIIAMIKGGDFNKKHGNKLMRMRVTLQGIALLFFALAMWAQNGS